MSLVRLAPSSGHPRHDCVATNGPGLLPQLRHWHHCRSQTRATWHPTGTLCHMARGLSPQRKWEQAPRVCAAKPCFSSPPASTDCCRCPTSLATQGPLESFDAHLLSTSCSGFNRNKSLSPKIEQLHER